MIARSKQAYDVMLNLTPSTTPMFVKPVHTLVLCPFVGMKSKSVHVL